MLSKNEWKDLLKEMVRLHGIAVGNVVAAQKQVDELEFNIDNYERKIKGLK